MIQKNKIFYYANPKTGSTSLRKIIENYHDMETQIKLFNSNKIWSQFNIKNIKNKIDKNDDINIDISEYFSFTTIRNPWIRVVSDYNYQKCDKNGIAFWETIMIKKQVKNLHLYNL